MTDDFPDGPLQKLERREFEERAVRSILDRMPLDRLSDAFGDPVVMTRYAPTRGHWSQGDRLPVLRSEDPAVMQAIGRCAVATLQRSGGLPKALSSTHDEGRCAWCDYPIAERLAACDWGVFRSRFVELETATWWQDAKERRGQSYRRTLRQDVYENPTWAAFWALPMAERQERIRAAQYPVEVPA